MKDLFQFSSLICEFLVKKHLSKNIDIKFVKRPIGRQEQRYNKKMGRALNIHR